MSSTMPMRVEGELFEAAKTIGAVASRSATQQLSHWARIGREFENAPDTNQGDIQRVLTGKPEITYDNLNRFDQAVVRAHWDETVAERRSRLNYADRFTNDGSAWSEADELGNVAVHRSANSRS